MPLDARLAHWPQPLLLGHRGSRNGKAENTLEALELAASHGVDGFEVDVRLNAEGSVVVFHDPTLARMTGGRDSRALASLNDQQLTAVVLDGGGRIPKLAAVLRYCRDNSLLLNVEIKSDDPHRPLVRNTLRALHGFPPEQLLLSSFDPRVVMACARQAPQLPRALIVLRRSLRLRLDHLSGWLGCSAICVDHQCIGGRYLDAAKLRRWQRARRVICWTVNSPERRDVLSAQGIDAIISDRPARFRPERALRNSLT